MAPEKTASRHNRMSVPSSRAMMPGKRNAFQAASASPVARACALNPVEPTRRKPSSQYRVLKMTAPTATPAI